MTPHSASPEPEITTAVDLCTPGGELNRSAVGWSRHPLHRANLSGWGRTKRWEYWCIQGPEHVLALTVSSIDYLALHTVWFMTYDGVEIDRTAIVPLGRVDASRTRSGGGEVSVARPGPADPHRTLGRTASDCAPPPTGSPPTPLDPPTGPRESGRGHPLERLTVSSTPSRRTPCRRRHGHRRRRRVSTSTRVSLRRPRPRPGPLALPDHLELGLRFRWSVTGARRAAVRWQVDRRHRHDRERPVPGRPAEQDRRRPGSGSTTPPTGCGPGACAVYGTAGSI